MIGLLLLRRMSWVAPMLLLTGCAGGSDGVATSAQQASPPRVMPWTMVGLGDSFMSTQNSAGLSYLDLFQGSLQAASGRTVDLEDLSSDVNTTARLVDQLRHDEAVRDAVAAADIVVVSVGGNDSDPFGIYPPGTCSPRQSPSGCLHAYAPAFAENYEVILSEIAALRAGRPTAVRVTSADNPFVGWSEAPSRTYGVRFYRQVAEAETEAACVAARRRGGRCVDYLHVFGGADGTADPAPYLGTDHAHPGDVGITTIAHLLIQLGVPELGEP